MATIRFKETKNLDINGRGRFLLEGEKMGLKDISVVRYRFKDIGQQEQCFLKTSSNFFVYSLHLLEVELNHRMDNAMKNFEVAKELSKELGMALFVYVSIYDNEVQENRLDSDKVEWLKQIDFSGVDRVMMLDRSNTLHEYAERELRKQLISIVGKQKRKIGVCGGSQSFTDGNQCLSALLARELMSVYCKEVGGAVPSRNHENMDCCGCLNVIDVHSDIQAAPIIFGGSGEKG